MYCQENVLAGIEGSTHCSKLQLALLWKSGYWGLLCLRRHPDFPKSLRYQLVLMVLLFRWKPILIMTTTDSFYWWHNFFKEMLKQLLEPEFDQFKVRYNCLGGKLLTSCSQNSGSMLITGWMSVTSTSSLSVKIFLNLFHFFLIFFN